VLSLKCKQLFLLDLTCTVINKYGTKFLHLVTKLCVCRRICNLEWLKFGTGMELARSEIVRQLRILVIGGKVAN